MTKTPFEIFLEDDGPYSRKLYGPVTPKSSMIDRSRERGSQKTLSQSKLVGGLNKLRREKLVYTPADNFREKVFYKRFDCAVFQSSDSIFILN